MNYHNTTNQKGKILDNFKAKASFQDDIIMEWFKANKGKEVSTDDIWINLFDPSVVPQTSIRRSITNLTSKGLLEKLDKQKIGIYGRPVYLWRLN
jgi:hypothetical protein